MKKFTPIFVAFLFLLGVHISKAQTTEQLTGLWLIEKVEVGDQEMTPVAKWTRIHPDGRYESGNGWLKSSEGRWTFDETTQAFLPKETNGLIDPFGAFTVSFSGERMQWQRVEEGMEVVVTLVPIQELPQAPADQVQGLWDLVKVEENGRDITPNYDPQGRHYVFIRWDRIYVERTPVGERQTGYWHMHGHRPEMTMLSHQTGQEPLSWIVQVTGENQLTMTGNSEGNKNQIRTYRRLHNFPE